jgi:quercetin dioxygenase-like cupin family protein
VYYFVNLVVYIVRNTVPTITATQTRKTETPNAVMTTLASPTLGGTVDLALWRVEMAVAASGPLHVVDSEQLLTVLSGAATVTLDGESHALGAGDTIVLPATSPRRIATDTGTQLLVAGHGDAIVTVPGEDAPRGTPPWIS